MATLTLDTVQAEPDRARRARAHRFNAWLAVADATMFAFAVHVATVMSPGITPLHEGARVALTVSAFAFLAFLMRTYTWRGLTHPAASVGRLVAALAVTLAWTCASGLHAPGMEVAAAGAASALGMMGSRLMARRILKGAFAKGAAFRRAMVIELGGSGRLAAELQSRSGNGIQVVTSVAMPILDVEQVIARARREGVDLVAVEASRERMAEALEAVGKLRVLPAEIAVVPDGVGHGVTLGLDAACSEPPPSSFGSMLVGAGAVAKRAEDIFVSGSMLFLLWPLMLLVAVAIKLESPGPVFFRQRRVGFNEQPFWVLKFRSMQAALADAGGGRQTGRNDARVTRVGRFIRRTSIDELPQLINVLLGDMSVVGPRPHPLEMRALGERLEVAAPGYEFRHRVKPGLTGWAQINGCRGEIDSVEKLRRRVDLDVEYIERWSVRLDLSIIARTASKVFGDSHAY